MIKRFFILACMLLAIFDGSSQNYAEYLDAARKHIKNSNFEQARKVYNMYIDLTNGRRDPELDKALSLARNKNNSHGSTPKPSVDQSKLINEYYDKAAEAYSSGDYDEAFKFFKKAADLGDDSSMFYVGDLYYTYYGSDKDAIEWYKKAANKGNVSALVNMGYAYSRGNNYKEAVKCYRKAAEKGEPTAMYNLGVCYENGRGVSTSYADAKTWYKKAISKGSVSALNGLGYLYFKGYGVKQNYTEAFNLYKQAAEFGHPKAQSYVGFMYENGLGVERDKSLAKMWYQKAAHQGDEQAIERLKLSKFK